MTFDEWFHKEYEPADLQIKQYAERKEGLHIPATVYLEDLKEAFEAGLHSDAHTDNSKVIAELEKENAELKEKLKPENCLKLLAKEGYVKFTSDNLDKAKEHIRTLISCLIDWVQEGDKDYRHIAEAEQFLSEVEK